MRAMALFSHHLYDAPPPIQGLCDASHGPDRALFSDHLHQSIVIEHWGRPTGIAANNPCHMFDEWTTKCDQVGTECDLVDQV